MAKISNIKQISTVFTTMQSWSQTSGSPHRLTNHRHHRPLKARAACHRKLLHSRSIYIHSGQKESCLAPKISCCVDKQVKPASERARRNKKKMDRRSLILFPAFRIIPCRSSSYAARQTDSKHRRRLSFSIPCRADRQSPFYSRPSNIG